MTKLLDFIIFAPLIMNQKKKKKSGPFLAFTAANYWIFLCAVVVLIVGYIFLSIEPVDGIWSLTIAPIVLVIGYCVLVPLAIFYRAKKRES